MPPDGFINSPASLALGAGADDTTASSPAPPDPYNIGAALKAGYNVTEIANYLSERGVNVAGARKAGYLDDEIVSHLIGKAPEPEPPAPAKPVEPVSSTWGGVSKALGQAAYRIPGELTEAGGAMVTSAGTAAKAGAVNSGNFAQRQLDIVNRIDSGEAFKPGAAGQNSIDQTLNEFGQNYAASDPDMRARIKDRLAGEVAVPPEDTGLSKVGSALQTGGKAVMGAGEAITKAGEAAYPLTEEERGRLSVTGVNIGAAVVPYAVAASLGGPAALAALAGVQGFGSHYKAAKEAGSSDEDAAIAGLLGGMVDAGLVAVPVHTAINVLAKVPSQLKSDALKTFIDMGKSAATGVTFTQMQTVADNLIAQHTYDPKRAATEHLGENIGLQAVVFGLLPFAGPGIQGASRLAGRGARGLLNRVLPEGPTIQPRGPGEAPPEPPPARPVDVMAAPDLDTAIKTAEAAATAPVADATYAAPTPTEPTPTVPTGSDSTALTVTPGPVDVRAEVDELFTGDSRDIAQGQLLRLFANTGAGRVEQTPDGGYQFRTTNAAGDEVTHPIALYQPGDSSDVVDGAGGKDARPPITTQQADALREHYGRAGVNVVFYKDDPNIPFDGAVDPQQPDTIFLSSNPERSVAQVANHEFTHVLATTALPDGTSLQDLLHQQISAGITPAGRHHANRMFGPTAPKRADFSNDADWAAAVEAHLINELGADIGGEAPKFSSFAGRVVDAVQARWGDSAAADVLRKMMDGLRNAMETIRGLFKEGGTRSQNWVSNIEDVHNTLAKMYAERFGAPVEREQAAQATVQDRVDRDALVTQPTERVPDQGAIRENGAAPDRTSIPGLGITPEAEAEQTRLQIERVRDVGRTQDALGERPLPTGWELTPDPQSNGYAVYDQNDQIVGRGTTMFGALQDGYAAADKAPARMPEDAAPDRTLNAGLNVPTDGAPASATWEEVRDGLHGNARQLRRWLGELADERDAAAAASPQARVLKQTEAAILRPVGGNEAALPEPAKARLEQVRDKIDEVSHPQADTPPMATVRAELATTAGELVEHTTKKGKVLTGAVRRDLDQAGAKKLDPFTFRKDGGWFIRQGKGAGAPAASVESEPTAASSGQAAGTQRAEPAPATPSVESRPPQEYAPPVESAPAAEEVGQVRAEPTEQPERTNQVTRGARGEPSPYVPVPKAPLRLAAFLQQKTVRNAGTIHETVTPGGIKDVGGNIASMIDKGRGRPGLIDNQRGRSISDAMVHAWENDYFPEYPSTGERPNDENLLLEALREDLTGNPQYSAADQDALDAHTYALAQNSEIDWLATEHDIDTKGLTRDQFFDRLADVTSLDELAAEQARMEAPHTRAVDEFEAALGDWDTEADRDSGEPRTLEELEDEYRQEDTALAAQEGDGGVARPGGARPAAGEGEEGQGLSGDVARPAGRDGAEAGNTSSFADLAINAPDAAELTNAAVSPGGLEPDRQNGTARPVLAQGDGSAAGAGTGSLSDGGRAGGAGDEGPDSGAGASAGGASLDGERGDLFVHNGDASGRAESIAPGGDFDGGSGLFGDGGVSTDEAAAGGAPQSYPADAPVDNARAAQAAAEDVASKPGLANIRETLPALLPGQQEDVFKTETRFSKPDGYGMLLTNGTGTGKTYSGLGAIKRFARDGRDNTLIVVPDDKVASDWIKSGKNLGLEITQLATTKDAGKGIVVTTYANLGQNDALASRQWDLIVPDEAHNLMKGADASVTDALQALRALTYHPDGALQRVDMENRPLVERITQLRAEIKRLEKATGHPGILQSLEKARADITEAIAELDGHRKAMRQRFEATQGASRPRVLFLSATPFAYEKNVEWAQGYLFAYPKAEREGYNVPSGRDAFMMQHFGYRMRTNRLTEPGPEVDRGLMQREFNSHLKREGALSSRVLDVAADYDRRFALIESGLGNRIDQALDYLRERQSMLRSSDRRTSAPERAAWQAITDHVESNFDYLSRMYLLEALKAGASIPIVRQHLALGRKIVVFHDFKRGGGFNPFAIDEAASGKLPPDQKAAFRQALGEFNGQFPDLVKADWSRLKSAVEQYRAAFGDNVLVVNGDEKQRDNLARFLKFQDDASGPQVLLVQSAKNAGWSGHDTTGKHQRALINLGLPVAPTTAIQQEGRIYRVGQVSNAIFRYLNTGTNWEKFAFASKIAQRASTAENLGMGEDARALKDSFISAFLASDDYAPGHEGEGTGGKALDRMSVEAPTPFARAKSFYWATEKKTSSTKAREGTDYFATPEPLGLKMVQWADQRGGEAALEPSAGHGAIARWMGDNIAKTFIEPSNELRARLALSADAATSKLVSGVFEDLNAVNKYDTVVMNPPFGVGGKTAIEHLAKAAIHTRDGGRIVALIPAGPSADKRFEAWLYGADDKGRSLHPDLHLAADVKLPTVTFERAATRVAARVVVIDKVSDPKAAIPQTVQRDLSDVTTTKELFNRLENMDLPGRLKAKAAEQPARPAQAAAPSAPPTPPPADAGTIVEHTTQKGKVLRGVIRTDLTQVQAQAIDPYTFRKGGGYFIREAHLSKLPPKTGGGVQFSPRVRDEEDPDRAPLYSALTRAVEGVKQDKASPGQWAATLKNMAGVKPEERAWTGLDDWLAKQTRSVTKAEVLDYLRANNLNVQEVMRGDETAGIEPRFHVVDQNGNVRGDWATRAEAEDYLANPPSFIDPERSRIAERAEPHHPLPGTKYGSYVLPGGKNYREMLLTLPAKAREVTIGEAHPPGAEYGNKEYVASWEGRREVQGVKEYPLLVDGEDVGRITEWPMTYKDRGEPGPAKWIVYTRDVQGARMDSLDAALALARERYNDPKDRGRQDVYRSSHWDEPNVLAHTRFSERAAPDGAKVLHIEEVQSDWHQAGRRQGYQQPLSAEDRAQLATLRQQLEDSRAEREQLFGRLRPGERLTREQEAQAEELNTRQNQLLTEISNIAIKDKRGVPEAPFKTTWPMLVMKRLITFAVDRGFDRVAWTPGDVQADRYDLSKQISRITLHDNSSGGVGRPKMDGPFSGGMLRAYDKNRREVLKQYIRDPAELPDLIGKEAADKLMAVTPKEASDAGVGVRERKLAGLELKVGGEGMKGFYDKQLPTEVQKLVGKYGAKVGKSEIEVPNPDYKVDLERDGAADNGAPAYAAQTVHSVDITDQLRDAVQAQGLPLFSPKVSVRNQREAEQWTPEEDQAYRNVGRVVDVPSLLERFNAWRQDIGRRLIRDIVDPYIGVKRDDPAGYVALRKANSSAGALNVFLQEGTLRFEGSGYDFATRNGGVEHHLVRPLRGDADRFLWWVAANRAEFLDAQDRENLFTQQDIDVLKRTNQGLLPFDYEMANGQMTRSREDAYNDSLRKLEVFNKNTLDLAKRSGLIGEDVVNELIKNPYYVPFYRLADRDAHFAGPSLTSGFVKQYAFKTLKGGKERLRNDLWGNAIQNWAHMIDASLRNRAAASVLDVAQTNGAVAEVTQAQYDHMSREDRENTVWIMNDGKKQYFHVEDPMLLTAITALHDIGDNPIMKAAAKFRTTLTRGTAASPLFMMRNFIRDAQQAIATTPTRLNIFENIRRGFAMGDTPRALMNIARAAAARETQPHRLSDETVSAIAGGATMSFAREFGSAAQMVNVKAIKGPNGQPVATVLDTPAKVQAFWHWLSNSARAWERAAGEFENVQRLALYHNLRAEGTPKDYASFEARDLTDFSLRGAARWVRYITTFVPFLNARLQGLYKVGRAAADADRNVAAAVGKKIAIGATKRMAIVMGALTMANLALDWMYSDDEDYKKRTEYDRSTYFWFKVAGVQFRIPMGYEVGALGRLASDGIEAFFGWNEMTPQRFRDNLFHTFGTNLSMNPTPQFVKPLLDVMQNQSWSGAPIVTKGQDRLQSEYQYNANTTMPARAISSVGNAATRWGAGPGASFLSPVQIDYLVQGYFGWLGTQVMNMADLAVRYGDQAQAAIRGVQPSEPVRPATDLLATATGGMIATEPARQSRYIDMLYQQGEAVSKAYATYQDLLKRGRVEEARDVFQENRDLIAQHGRFAAVERAETELNRAIKQIGESRTLTAEQKRLQIMRLNAQRNRAAESIFGTRQPVQ